MAKREFYERADYIYHITSFLIATSALGSHNKLDIKKTLNSYYNLTGSMYSIFFPYLKNESGSSIREDEYEKAWELLKKLNNKNNMNDAKVEENNGNEST